MSLDPIHRNQSKHVDTNGVLRYNADNSEVFPGPTGVRSATMLYLADGRSFDGRLQYDDDGRPIVRLARCGHCGFEWNDALITSITPVPSGRCPNEYEHEEER